VPALQLAEGSRLTMAGRRMNWEQMKRNSARALEESRSPSRVPAGRMPPLTGERALRAFGRCPKCGQARWWDQRVRKMLGGIKSNAPDAVCAFMDCRFAIWPKEEVAAS
jgi:hypothetical protein